MKTWKQNLKHLSKREYEFLHQICYLSKNVYNESIYNIRQHYFIESTYLRYEANYQLMKNSENYKKLGAGTAQQTMKSADASFKSFFGLLKLAKKGKYESWKIKLPSYLEKDSLHIVSYATGALRFSDTDFLVPMTMWMKEQFPDVRLRIKIPEYIRDKHLRQIYIVPKFNGKYFEVRYVFDDKELEKPKLNMSKALSIDLGVNNFATCVTSDGDSFIVDGKKLKSINQWYNKELARLSSIKDHQNIKTFTHLQHKKTTKRNNQVQDFIYKSAKYIVSYCIEHEIGNIVVGYNDGFQDRINLGKVNNQTFVMLPYGKFKSRLEYLCNLYGINFVQQEESYTSKASYFDDDEIPKWNPLNPVEKEFSGNRISRGLYKTQNGIVINADVNGALNILRKSNLQKEKVKLQSISPIRIQVV